MLYLDKHSLFKTEALLREAADFIKNGESSTDKKQLEADLRRLIDALVAIEYESETYF